MSASWTLTARTASPIRATAQAPGPAADCHRPPPCLPSRLRCWRASARTVSEAEKRAALAAYGDPGPPHDSEYDHLISVELGGASTDPRNLWPEPGASPNPKDRLEARLTDLVCERRMSWLGRSG
jgi:hypothetical protein